jgi:hypothetical protein
MKNKLILTIAVVVVFCTTIKLSAQADINRLKKDVYTLAADSFLGRKPATKGDSLSQQYILNQIKLSSAKLLNQKGLQPVSFISTIEILPDNTLKIGNDEMQLRRDFVPALFSSSQTIESTAIFAGYGLYLKNGDSTIFDHYFQKNVEGKWVILLQDAPKSMKISKRELRDRSKVLTAKDKGAAGVLNW